MPLPAITLCADDFAMSPETSQVIADLARRRCINAISCMAAAEGWASDARLLDGIEQVECGSLGRVQVGLHLVLASEKPIGAMSCVDAEGRMPGPDKLLAMTIARRIDPGEFEAEIDRQFAAFIAARGCEPDFVDAHQHVHVYPTLRRLIIDATRRHAPKAWVRVPSDSLSAMISRPFTGKAIGSALHAAGYRAALVRSGIAANDSFGGHYDFASGYADLLPRFLSRGSAAHVVMCHPGSAERGDDTIAAARVVEAEVIGRMDLETRVAQLRKAAA